MTRKTDTALQPTKGRRDFLKFASTAAPLAAIAVANGGQAQAAVAPVDPTSDRMQDTEHTRAYYDSARF